MNKQVENYILQYEIGQGQYGCVYKGFNKKTNQTVAIKKMNNDKFKKIPKLYDFIKNEIDILSRIDHPNIIKFIEILRTTNNIYLVYEYCNGGDLEKLLAKRKILSEVEANQILQQLISAFKILANKNILHRDLKPGNIIFNNNQIKVADFGFCKALENSEQMTKTMVGSPIYMAPEILKGFNYSVKADIWSIGVVYFEMLFGHCPFEDSTIQKLINLINQKPLSFPNNNISKNSQDLLRKMLVVDPNERIEWDDLIQIVISNTAENTSIYLNDQINTKTPKSQNSLSIKPYFSCVNKNNQSQVIKQEFISTDNELIDIAIHRNKIIFLINMIKQVIQNSRSQTGYQLAFYLINKTRSQYEILTSKFFSNPQISYQKIKILKVVNEEEKQLQQFQDFLKEQFPNLILNLNLIEKYVQEIKNELSDIDFSDQKNVLIFLKQLIDFKDDDNFFQNNLNEPCSYEQQSYFKKNNNLYLQDLKQIIFSMIQ